MNPLAVESALKLALLPFFPSGVTLYTGASYEITQPESLNVVVSCDDLQHQCGGLYYAETTIRMIGPAMYGAKVFSDLGAALGCILAAVQSGEFAAGWPVGSPGYRGNFLQRTTSKTSGEQWDIEVSLRVGVEF